MVDGWTFRDLQREQAAWALKNFGTRPAWQPLLGMVEEIGELDEAADRESTADAIADTVVFMADFCTLMGFDLDVLYTSALEELGPHRPFPQRTVAIGKIAHAYLKLTQGIRGTKAEHEATMKKHLVLLLMNLHLICNARGFVFPMVVYETWQEVSKRDWTKNVKTGIDA